MTLITVICLVNDEVLINKVKYFSIQQNIEGLGMEVGSRSEAPVGARGSGVARILRMEQDWFPPSKISLGVWGSTPGKF